MCQPGVSNYIKVLVSGSVPWVLVGPIDAGYCHCLVIMHYNELLWLLSYPVSVESLNPVMAFLPITKSQVPERILSPKSHAICSYVIFFTLILHVIILSNS